LQWGNPASMEALIRQTVRREGIGEWSAKGARELARYFGAEEEAVQVNGLEVPYHDPRGCSGMALVYATSPRGACHNQSDYFLIDMGQELAKLGITAIDRHAGAEKAKNVAMHQDWRTIANSLVLCVFANVPATTVLELINASCGLDWDIEQMMRCGERGFNLKRVINHRLGLNGQNDKLPKSLLLPYIDHPESADGFVPEFENMLTAYYQARGWDSVTGVPTKQKLISLALDWLVEDL
jgi:aldehyde:ferredoxin oxidoreductase